MNPCFSLLLSGVLAAGATAALAAADGDEASSPGMHNDLVFTLYSPLSIAAEIVHRMLSPLDAQRVMQASMRTGKGLQGQAVDLSKERFAVYVPREAPSGGYGVFVYVSPYQDAAIPLGYTSALDRHGMIFVTASHSGNSENVFDRRAPLALLAAHNIESRYAVDSRRVYVGGFSGGSRVAERLAVAYPELFHGVLLYAGSDSIGNAHFPLPEAQIFSQFQESTRVIFATGSRDAYHLAEDVQSERSMQEWCVFAVADYTIPWTGHELPDAASFDRLLDALEREERPAAEKVVACRARIDAAVAAEIGEVRALMGAGKLDKARRSLEKMDARFSGLAAPRSVELAGELARIRN